MNKSPATVGRKRDHTRDAAILQATLDALVETGYADITIEMVARRAGAGRGTIYRRWASKDELILAAISCVSHGDVEEGRLPDTGELRRDLLALADPDWLGDGERRLRILASAATMVGTNPELLAAFNRSIIEPTISAYRYLIQRSILRGEYPEPADIEVLAQAVPAMTAYRALFTDQPVDCAFLTSIVDIIVGRLGGGTPPRAGA